MDAQPAETTDEVRGFCDAAEFATWLTAHGAARSGLWLKLAKKGAGVASITYAEAVEIALCHGWIDGQKRAYDDAFWLQRFTQRGPRSIWSKINRDKAEALITSGRMLPAGLAAIEAARLNGRWEAAYDSPRAAQVPEDLLAELAEVPAAQARFATLDSRNRYAILHRLQTAKLPATRARRIASFVEMLVKGELLYP